MKYQVNLHMFDGEGAGAAAGGAAPGNAAGGTAGAGTPGAAGTGKDALASVVYGKAPAEGAATEKPVAADTAKGTATTEPSQAEREAEFDKLISKGGQYHDLFGMRAQGIIDQRFAETKGLKESMGKLQPVMDRLAQRYGIDPNDTDGMMKALDQDTSLLEAEAAEKGTTVEVLKELKRQELENKTLKRREAEVTQQREAEETARRWQEQAMKTAAVYPNFDIVAEMNHATSGEEFKQLIRAGIDVKTAYEIIHKDELLSGAIAYAAQTAQKKTIDNIRARGMRPPENGASGSGSAAIVKSDPSKWTLQDLKEVERRVMRGERIEL